MFALKELTRCERMLPKREHTLSIFRMQILTPSIVPYLLKIGLHHLTKALIAVVNTAIWRRRPHQLWHRFGQHAPVLLAFFELLFGSFLVLNIGAGTNPVQDRALGISLRHASDQKPAIRSAGTIL